MSEHVRFPIDGMTCTSCVAHITKAVRKVPGVDSVRVDLGSDSASVAFDPRQTSLTAIAGAIREAGYEPQIELAEAYVEAPRRRLLDRLGLGRHSGPI